MKTSTQKYYIFATATDNNGQEIICDSSYALGDQAGVHYGSEEEAEAAADEFREDVGDAVDSSVVYHVSVV